MKSPPILNGVLSMPSKLLKIIILIILCLTISFGTYKFCYFVAEKYFFDKFFYQKSIEYGYVDHVPKYNLEDSGDRAKDIIALNNEDQNILGASDNGSFKIAIIGDSYVWGMGIKNNQRAASILEKKLNKIRPTKVIAVGDLGGTTLDYLKRYDQLQQIVKTDLNIFFLVTNDAFLYRGKDYKNIVKNCVSQFPNTEPIYEIFTELILKNYDFGNQDQNFEKIVSEAFFNSWTNPINKCVVETSSQFLPINKSVYFITDNYINYNYNNFNSYIKAITLTHTNKYILSSEVGQKIPKYSKFFDDPYKNFQVSQQETHPNALANQMYADILYNEITTNPQWSFINAQ